MYFDGVALSELLRYFDRPLEIFASPFSDFFPLCHYFSRGLHHQNSLAG